MADDYNTSMKRSDWERMTKKWDAWKKQNPGWVAKKNARKALDKRVQNAILKAQANKNNGE